MAMEWRGGIPVVFQGTVANTGVVTDSRGRAVAAGTPLVTGAHQVQSQVDGRRGPITPKWLRIANLDGSVAIRVYFSQDHYDDDVHYVTLAPGGVATSVWEGPGEAKEIWLRAAAVGTPAFDITAFNRRG